MNHNDILVMVYKVLSNVYIVICQVITRGLQHLIIYRFFWEIILLSLKRTIKWRCSIIKPSCLTI